MLPENNLFVLQRYNNLFNYQIFCEIFFLKSLFFYTFVAKTGHFLSFHTEIALFLHFN